MFENPQESNIFIWYVRAISDYLFQLLVSSLRANNKNGMMQNELNESYARAEVTGKKKDRKKQNTSPA